MGIPVLGVFVYKRYDAQRLVLGQKRPDSHIICEIGIYVSSTFGSLDKIILMRVEN